MLTIKRIVIQLLIPQSVNHTLTIPYILDFVYGKSMLNQKVVKACTYTCSWTYTYMCKEMYSSKNIITQFSNNKNKRLVVGSL